MLFILLTRDVMKIWSPYVPLHSDVKCTNSLTELPFAVPLPAIVILTSIRSADLTLTLHAVSLGFLQFSYHC